MSNNVCPHGYPLVQQRYCQDCQITELEAENERLDARMDDLRALREFAGKILLSKKSFFPRIEAERLGLLDADGKPTRRLTGE